MEEIDERYTRGKIYTITCEDGAVYVGSTIETLNQRLTVHKSDKNCSMYQYINDNYNGDWSNCKIKLYENYPCNNEYELKRKEGKITKLIGTINKCIAGRTRQEYYEDNKEIIAEKKKEWYEKNKEVIAEKQKEYYEDNKEIILEKIKEYYENNKEKIAEYRNEKIVCECGCLIRRGDIARHRKSQKHIDLMKSISSF